MKKLINILSLLIVFNFCNAQSEKEKKFEKAVYKIVAAYNNKNSTAFNDFINKKNGLYFLIQQGAYTYWAKKNSIKFYDTISNAKLPLPYSSMLAEQKIAANFKIKYASYPIFDCNTKNIKIGLFVDTAYKVNSFSNLIKKYIKYNDLGLHKQDLKNQLKTINTIESASRKIVITGKNNSTWGESFIFYLSYINDKWVISIIDFATFDCSV